MSVWDDAWGFVQQAGELPGMAFEGVKNVAGAVGNMANAFIDPVANALGVHPDVIKVAAAALGIGYAAEQGFFDAATGAAMSDAAAADAIAASGAEALAAGGNYDAAISLANATNPAAAPGIATKAAYIAQNPGVAYESLTGPSWSWPTAAAPAAATAIPIGSAAAATEAAAVPLTSTIAPASPSNRPV